MSFVLVGNVQTEAMILQGQLRQQKVPLPGKVFILKLTFCFLKNKLKSCVLVCKSL